MAGSRQDASPRSGSATSLLLTVVGLYLRRIGGSISTACLVALAESAGVAAPLARTSIARLKKRGVLVPESSRRASGYRLSGTAERMLERGDRRIFHVHRMRAHDSWCLISFSIPEAKRAVRGQLRRRLVWIGAGLISSALWICPDFLRDEVEEILTDLGVREHAVLFTTKRPRVAGSFSQSVAQWWDLDRIATLHERFTHTAARILAEPDPDPAAAFRGYATGIDAWRVIPYLDPGLPFEVLPADWPGRRTEVLFDELSVRLAAPSWDFVCATVGISADVARTATGSIPTILTAG